MGVSVTSLSGFSEVSPLQCVVASEKTFLPNPNHLKLSLTITVNNTWNWPAVADNTVIIYSTEYLENPNTVNVERVPNSHDFMSSDKYSRFHQDKPNRFWLFFFSMRRSKSQGNRKRKQETVKKLYSQISSYGSCPACERSWSSSQDPCIFTSAEQCNSKKRKKEEEGIMTADCDVENSNQDIRSK